MQKKNSPCERHCIEITPRAIDKGKLSVDHAKFYKEPAREIYEWHKSNDLKNTLGSFSVKKSKTKDLTIDSDGGTRKSHAHYHIFFIAIVYYD